MLIFFIIAWNIGFRRFQEYKLQRAVVGPRKRMLNRTLKTFW